MMQHLSQDNASHDVTCCDGIYLIFLSAQNHKSEGKSEVCGVEQDGKINNKMHIWHFR